MCLLKRDQKDSNCGHAECKSYYMLNKQMCVHNGQPGQTSNNSINTSNLLLQAQDLQKPFQQPLMLANLGVSQSLNTKRSLIMSDNLNIDEKDVAVSNKKKIKTKDENDKVDGQQPQHGINNMSLNFSALGMMPQQQNAGDNLSLFNSQTLNGLLLQNPHQIMPKIEIPQSQNNDMIANFLQNSHNNPGFNNMFANHTAFNLNHLLSQNLNKTSNTPVSNQQINTLLDQNKNENQAKSDHILVCENYIKEFQAKTYNLLYSQNKMLSDLKEKNDTVQDTLACLINEVNTLKNIVSKITSGDKPLTSNSTLLTHHQIIGNSTESITADDLITYLYGPTIDFQYHLVFKSDLALPLYRERNFKFTVLLVDQNGLVVENANRIPLTIGIYSSENPPKYIDANTAGNKILKGFIEKDLINGAVTFEKIQIKEVTSHFRNGWIFFVVYPKLGQNPNNNVLIGTNGVTVNSQKIKPLILEKVIVKAKKTKEKEQNNDDGSPNSGGYQIDNTKEEASYD